MNQQQTKSPKPIAPWALLLVACLWIAVVISALAVVSATQQVRRDVNQLETLRREASHLQVEWGQYLLEESTWAAYSRIENIANQELSMIAPTTEHIVMVSNDD